MCLHKHVTLYISIFTILKESYTSPQASYRAVQAWHPTEQLSAVFPPGEEPVQASVTRPGCPSLGLSSGRQQLYEDPLGPVLVGIWGQEPQVYLCLGLTGKLVSHV